MESPSGRGMPEAKTKFVAFVNRPMKVSHPESNILEMNAPWCTANVVMRTLCPCRPPCAVWTPTLRSHSCGPFFLFHGSFHLVCVATWLNSSRQTCPMCRYVVGMAGYTGMSFHVVLSQSNIDTCMSPHQLVCVYGGLLSTVDRADWEYGASSDQRRTMDTI